MKPRTKMGTAALPDWLVETCKTVGYIYGFEEEERWVAQLTAASRPGVDTDKARDKFVLWLLEETRDKGNPIEGTSAWRAITTATDLMARRVAGDNPADGEWEAARRLCRERSTYSRHEMACAAWAVAGDAQGTASSSAAAIANTAGANARYFEAAMVTAMANYYDMQKEKLLVLLAEAEPHEL